MNGRNSGQPGFNAVPPADAHSRWRRWRRAVAAAVAIAAWALGQAAGAATQGAAIAPGPLLQAAQLQALLRDGASLRIVDLRDADTYAGGHLPGAVNAPYAAWRGDSDNPGRLLGVADFTRLVRSLGLHRDDRVVLVSQGGSPSDFGAPARVYWTLQWLGMRHLSILNGGMQAWRAAGLGGLQHAAPAIVPSHFQAHSDGAVLATRAQVLRLVDQPQASTVLLDARPPAFWQGRVKAPAALRPGTLAGAVDFNNLRWFPQGGGALPDASTLRSIARGLPPAEQRAAQTVSFCNTGHWAATNWFVLSQLLHRPDVRLYPGSMVDWSRHDEPMIHVPSRLDQLWAQLQQTWQAR